MPHRKGSTKKTSESLRIQSEKVSLFYFERAKTLQYEILSNYMRKRILWEEQGEKCNHCGFNKYDLKIGPYELHHIDGNRLNKSKDNEEVICCNCHAMTPNDRYKNRKLSEKARVALDKHKYLGRKRMKELYVDNAG